MNTFFEAHRPSQALKILCVLFGFSAFLPTVIGILLLLAMGFVVVFRHWVRRERIEPVERAWWWFLAIFLIWPMLSSWGGDPDVVLARWLHVLRAALFVGIALLIPSRLRPQLLLGLMLGAVYMVLVVVIHQSLMTLPAWGLWKDLLDVRGNSSSQKWIVLATMASCSLWLALDPNQDRRARWGLGVLWVVMTVVVGLYAESRNAHVLLVLLPAGVLLHKLGTSVKGLTLAAVALTLGTLLVAQLPAVDKRIDKAWAGLQSFQTTGNYESSAAVRAKMYMTAWDHMWQAPITGQGLGAWMPIWESASQDQPATSGYNNPHNDFLLWGMESGLPGLLLLVVFFVLLLLPAFKQKNVEGGLGWLFGSALLVTCTINAPFRDATLGMALIVMAVAFAKHRKTK
jgi:O-antigen ligase